MWQLAGYVEYSCNHCSMHNSVPSDWFDLEVMGGSERGMGSDTYYFGRINHKCENCERDLEIELHVVEYPVGALNYISMKSNNATITKTAEIEFVDDSPIWLPPNREIIVPNSRIIADYSEITNAIPKLIQLIKNDSSYIYKITTREFEQIVAEIFRAAGYSVHLTKRTRDGGKDIIAIQKNDLGLETSYFIECKRHSLENKVDVGIVREVYGVHSSKDGPNKSIIATTSTFTPDALNFANQQARSRWDLQLKDINDVLAWIQNYKYSPQV